MPEQKVHYSGKKKSAWFGASPVSVIGTEYSINHTLLQLYGCHAISTRKRTPDLGLHLTFSHYIILVPFRLFKINFSISVISIW